MIKTGREKV